MTTSLACEYFTKEAVGYQLENKFGLLTLDPTGFIYRLDSFLNCQHLRPLTRQFAMGNQPSGIQMWQYLISFYGFKTEGLVTQLLMAVHDPNGKFKVPIMKVSTPGQNQIQDSMVRLEDKSISKPHSPTKFTDLLERLSDEFGQLVVCFGTMQRTKTWLYVTNSLTHSNYGVSADLCIAQNRLPLSQVEVEFKGRNGLWRPRDRNCVVTELGEVSNIVCSAFLDWLVPSSRTKLEWLLGL